MRVIARLRNKAPLAVESTFGEGRVVAILDQGLAAGNGAGQLEQLGARQSQLRRHDARAAKLFVGAAHAATPRCWWARRSRCRWTRLKPCPRCASCCPRGAGGGAVSVDATTTESGHAAVLSETGASGVYQAHLTASDGSQAGRKLRIQRGGPTRAICASSKPHNWPPVARHSLHVLRRPRHQLLRSAVGGIQLGESLLYLLVAVLVGEQLLAYACSYHPAAAEGRRR